MHLHAPTCTGLRVRLDGPRGIMQIGAAHSLGAGGSVADDWIIEDVSTDGVRIKNVRTDYTTTLGKDHIYDYVSNPDRSRDGVKHGFLTLKVQLFLNTKGVSITPTPRPGESVEPAVVQIQEKWVDADYPARSGLKIRLEAAGYSLSWAWDSKLGGLELNDGVSTSAHDATL